MRSHQPPGARALRISYALPLLAAGLILVTLGTITRAAPPAGAVIGNQATATYEDATGTSRTTSSNLVQTTVSQVRSFLLTANGARTAAPGQTVYYPHTITNTGNGTDTYALDAPTTGGAFTHTALAYHIDANGDGVPDNATAISSSGPVPAGTQFRFVAAGVVPAGATSGQQATIIVSVTDGAANNATNTDTTTVSNSVITVTKAMAVTSGPSPSASPITVTLSYTNSGTAVANNVVLTDALPAGFTYVANSGRWSVSGGTGLGDGAGGDPAGINYSFSAGTVSATITSVGAGVSGTVTFQVNVAAGLAPTTPSNLATTTNTASYATDTQAATNTNSVTYSVQQTANVVANGSAVSNVDGTNEPVLIASASPGTTMSFSDYVWNTGNGSDTLNVALSGSTYPAGTAFALFQSDGVTSLLDSNGDGIADTGPLASGGSYRVVVRVTLPVTAPAGGSDYDVTLTATSTFDPARSNGVVNRLGTISANTVDLTNNVSVAGGAGAGDGLGSSGATIITTNSVTPTTASVTQTRFRLYVNNTSTVTDTYDLAVISALPAGWTVTFAADGGAGNCSSIGAALTNTGPLAAGGNRLVCALVNVPATNTGNAAPGNYDFTFRARSALNTAVLDTKVDRVTVNTFSSVALTPNGAQQTFPGSAVTYNHVLANNGNVAENVTFAAGFLTDSQAGVGWTSALYADSDGNGVLDVGTDAQVTTATVLALAPNESVALFVRVFAPASASSASAPNITTVTARYNAGAASVSANDTTSVSDGLLLTKEQVAVSCAAPGPHAGYSTAAIPAGPATEPGACIAYRITALNTTAAAITNVVLADIIPANTTRADSCGAPAATGGATLGGTSANGTGGSVTATLASLASSGSFQLTFCARIDP